MSPGFTGDYSHYTTFVAQVIETYHTSPKVDNYALTGWGSFFIVAEFCYFRDNVNFWKEVNSFLFNADNNIVVQLLMP